MSDKKLLIKAVLFGTVCGLLVTVILVCILSAIVMTSGLLPTKLTNYITLALLALGAFSGGFITSRITKSAGLVVGLITGFAIFILITVIGLTKSDDPVSLLTLIRLVALLVAGGIGGIRAAGRSARSGGRTRSGRTRKEIRICTPHGCP